MKGTRRTGVADQLAGFVTTTPSPISDVLYLIAAHHEDVVDPETVERLNHANLSFLRGDFLKALGLVETVLAELEVSQPAYKSVTAFRMLLQSMIGPDPDRWKKDVDEKLLAVPGAPKVVYLCIESHRFWHSGKLFQGLRLNQYALQQSQELPAQWRIHALLLLVKKLTDLHFREQAHRLINMLENCVHDSGLLAFEAVAEALRSLLYLQAGALEKALKSVAEALSIAQCWGSPIGVKLALSVGAMAHLRRRDRDNARAYLKLFHAQNTPYVLPDSVARAAVAEIALVTAAEGPRRAAEQIRARSPLLGTESACFVEDVTRPAWLVAVARRAGDLALAEQMLRAIERLAGDNDELRLVTTAAEHARAVHRGEDPPVPFTLDLGDHSLPRIRTTYAASEAPKGPRVSRAIRPPRQAAPRTWPADLPTLTARENEVASLVSRGMTNQQVARELGLSAHTVNFHLRRIFRKFSISSRTQLSYLLTQSTWPPAPRMDEESRNR